MHMCVRPRFAKSLDKKGLGEQEANALLGALRKQISVLGLEVSEKDNVNPSNHLTMRFFFFFFFCSGDLSETPGPGM